MCLKLGRVHSRALHLVVHVTLVTPASAAAKPVRQLKRGMEVERVLHWTEEVDDVTLFALCSSSKSPAGGCPLRRAVPVHTAYDTQANR